MEATTSEPVATLVDDETIEFSINLPNADEYVPCEQCPSTVKDGKITSSRSYMFYLFKDSLFSFCKHHGEYQHDKLIAAGGFLVMDTRDRLIENRQKGLN